jgi:hypothetical protein
MKNLVRFALISGVLAGAFGCSASSSSEEAAAEARVDAADARTNAAEATARGKAADAHVRAADAAVDAADADVRAANAAVDAADADQRAKQGAAKPVARNSNTSRARVVIPAGTTLKVSLLDGVDSETSSAGDNFTASLAESVVIDGATLLQKGTKLRGRVINADGAGRVEGRASIELTLTDIMQGDRMIPITTQTFAARAESTQKRDVGVVAGAAGVGAVIGAIAGGKKGAGIGAVTGGGAGTGVVLATKGKEIHYGPETRLNFTLANSVEL